MLHWRHQSKGEIFLKIKVVAKNNSPLLHSKKLLLGLNKEGLK